MFNIESFLGLNYYSSELDNFLENLHTPLSASQLKEIQKYTRIHTLRDKALPSEAKNQFWENF